VSGAEVLPSGFETVTCAVPAEAMSDAGMAAVNCVLLTNVVLRALPFHLTVEPETKFVPFTVRLNAGPPTIALDGLSEVSETAAQEVKVFSRTVIAESPARTNSLFPSPFRSADLAAAVLPVTKLIGVWNVPSPFPSRIDRL
jgi:hypothetical protein